MPDESKGKLNADDLAALLADKGAGRPFLTRFSRFFTEIYLDANLTLTMLIAWHFSLPA